MVGASRFVLIVASVLVWWTPTTLVNGEIFSDLADIVTPPPAVEKQALEAKADAFWKVIMASAEHMKLSEHVQLYQDTEQVIQVLRPESTYVREALTEVLERLRRADEMVLQQAVQSSAVASEHLQIGTAGDSIFSSFFSGGQNALKQAIRRFVSGGQYAERLEDQVAQRQADVMPVLRGAASATPNVLTDTRLASKRSFDILKYDIYNKGVPKTPQVAKDVANRLVDASSETRRRFTQFITQTVNGIASDFTGRADSAASSSAQSSLHEALARAEASDKARRPIVDV